MEQGDIVIINFPFTSLENSKIRPALVISNKNFHYAKNVLLLAISTQKGIPLYSTPLRMPDLEIGHLKKESYIKFSNILSIEKKLIIKKVAKLKSGKIREIHKQLDFFIHPTNKVCLQ